MREPGVPKPLTPGPRGRGPAVPVHARPSVAPADAGFRRTPPTAAASSGAPRSHPPALRLRTPVSLPDPPPSAASGPFWSRAPARAGGAEAAGYEARRCHGGRGRGRTATGFPGRAVTCPPTRLRGARVPCGRRRPAHHPRVGHQRGARGAHFAEGPHLADGRVVAQYQDDRARAGDPGAFVQRAPLPTAPAGGVGPHSGRSGMGGGMGLGEAAQGREVA